METAQALVPSAGNNFSAAARTGSGPALLARPQAIFDNGVAPLLLTIIDVKQINARGAF